MNRKQIGANIDKIRKSKGLTKTELGRRMGFEREYLTTYKHLKDGPFSIDSLFKYCEILDCSPEDLLKEPTNSKEV